MSFDFDLVPPAGAFEPAGLDELRRWWAGRPTEVTDDGVLLVFPDDETRATRLARRAADPTANDYLTAQVHFTPESIELSVTGESVVTRWLYEFALEAARRFSADLQYFGESVPAQDILDAEG